MSSEAQPLSSITSLLHSEPSITSHVLRSEFSNSVFGDSSCGEPLISQHIKIDFDPIEGVDSEFVQNKCCAFWEFIASRPELGYLMVYPENNEPKNKSKSDETLPPSFKPEPEYNDRPNGPMTTAVSMLDIVEKQGLVDCTFEAKLPKSICSLGSREYHETERNIGSRNRSTRKKNNKTCSCNGTSKSCKRKPTASPSSDSLSIKNICKEMQEWDERHPKCHPNCKTRRECNGNNQKSSIEVLLEKRPFADCFRKWPKKMCTKNPYQLFGSNKKIDFSQRNESHDALVRVCQAPVDRIVTTPYLRYAHLAKQLGAWDAVRACCAFCECGACCPCDVRAYLPHDEERSARRKSDMRDFDTRVKNNYMKMTIMYDKV